MQKFYCITIACLLVFASSRFAFASEGHSLPWGDFLLRIITFAVFIGIIWRAAGKSIKGFFAGRRSEIVREMEELAARRKEAEARLADIEQQIAHAEAECIQLLNEGRVQAERMKASILAEAEAQAAKIVEQASRSAEQEGRAELEALRIHMADSIVDAVEKRLVETLDAKTHQKLIDKSLTKVVLQ